MIGGLVQTFPSSKVLRLLNKSHHPERANLTFTHVDDVKDDLEKVCSLVRNVLATICAIAGLAAMSGAPPIGIFLLILAGLFFYFGRPVHYVRLHTSGGEVKAVKSYDLEYVKQIVTALNNAIVSQHRSA